METDNKKKQTTLVAIAIYLYFYSIELLYFERLFERDIVDFRMIDENFCVHEMLFVIDHRIFGGIQALAYVATLISDLFSPENYTISTTFDLN